MTRRNGDGNEKERKMKRTRIVALLALFSTSAWSLAQKPVTLVVDDVSLDLVRGSAVDFVSDLGGAAFKVTNPNATAGCGCGTSFSV